MNEVSIFNFNDSFPVRTVTIDSETWFVGKDICKALGYENETRAMNQHCKGVSKRYPLATPGGKQEVRILSEADVMRLICGSNLPSAVKFERWVFEEVLPSIRKTGKYAVPFQPELPLDAAPESGLSALLRMRYKGVPVIPTPDLAKAFGITSMQLHNQVCKGIILIEGLDIFHVKGVSDNLARRMQKTGYSICAGCIAVNLWTENGIRKLIPVLNSSKIEHKQLVCSAPVVAERKPEQILQIPKRTDDSVKVYQFNLRDFFEFDHPIATENLLKKLHDAGFEVSKELAEVKFLHFAQHKFLSLIDNISNNLYSELLSARSFLNENSDITGKISIKNGEQHMGEVGVVNGKEVNA